MKQNYIPTINISSLVSKDLGSKESLKIIKKIEKACVEVGFFQVIGHGIDHKKICLLYTSPSPRDGLLSRMPSSA